MAGVILEARNISKSYKKQILSQVDLAIKEGEIHVLMGRSGEGKSTLLKILAGLVSTETGVVSFEGTKLENPDEVLVAGHEELAYVAQNFNLLHNRTVLENLKDALITFKDEFADQQIGDLLQLMRLDAIKEQKIERLSGGEKQRLAIARALATQPAVLLLDEPFTQLDFLTRQLLLDAIKEVNRELLTSIILVSHNIYEAFYLADTVHILKDGVLLKSASPESIYAHPEFIEVANILGEINFFEPGSLKKSQKGLKGIWSERVEIKSIDEDIEGEGLEAILKEVVFLGASYRCTFELKNGKAVQVITSKSSVENKKKYKLLFPDKFLFDLKSY